MDYYVLTPVSILLRILEAFSQFSIVLLFIGNKVFSRNHLFGAVLFSIIFELVKIIIPQYLSGFMTVVLGIGFISIYFRGKLWKVSIAYLITGVVAAILDFIVSFGMKLIFGLESISEIAETPYLYNIGSIFISSGLILVGIILKKIKNKTKLLEKESFNKTAVINNIITFMLLIPNLVMLMYYYDNKQLPVYIVFINICAIILMFFVNTYNTKKGFELVVAEQELITQRTYNKTLQNLVDGLRTFKHDYNNTLQTMYGYIQLENMTGLKTFFEQILDESRAITALDKLNPERFKNPSLFGIITAKYEYSKQNNVNIDFEMYGQIEDADMQIYDLTRIIGIFLDNAIEAATGSEKKKVNFMVTDRKGFITIEISNTYSEVGLKIDKINQKGVSSKGENRGLGLYKVKEILKKYSTVKHETTAQNGMFRQKLVINKVKVKV